jgi:hypothetical protein
MLSKVEIACKREFGREPNLGSLPPMPEKRELGEDRAEWRGCEPWDFCVLGRSRLAVNSGK